MVRCPRQENTALQDRKRAEEVAEGRRRGRRTADGDLLPIRRPRRRDGLHARADGSAGSAQLLPKLVGMGQRRRYAGGNAEAPAVTVALSLRGCDLWECGAL